MKIFLCYASEDRATAESIAFSLRSRRYEVFFDGDDLSPGARYNEEIERAIKGCHIFVFLISPDSVAEGRYTLAELEFARRKWPSPHGRVLPVMARRTPLVQVPPYLKAVPILEPSGGLAANTSAAVDEMYVGTGWGMNAAADYDEVHLGAVTPHTVFLGEPFVARFAAYTDTTRAIISEIIESEAPGSHIRLGLDRSRWQRNTEVTVRLEANNARVANHVQTFRWDGSYKILRYDITVLDNISDNRLILKFDVFVEGLLIISLRPETKVQRNANTNATPLSLVEKPAPRTAFASYVSARAGKSV